MKKNILILGIMFLSLFFLSNQAHAYSIESAKDHAHYEHPELKIIEDAGNNMAIGQGMTENVLHPMALFEDIDGVIYLGLRFNLAKDIQNVNFSVQNRGEKDFIQIDYEILSEDEETRDFRMVVPSKDIILRAEAFIEAMGRPVIFYIDFSDFVEGNTDFVALGENGASTLKSELDLSKKVELKAANELANSSGLGYSHGLLMKGSPELTKVFGKEEENELGHNSSGESTPETSSKLGPVSLAVINGFVVFIVIITTLFLATAIVLFLLTKRVREINEAREEALYDED